MYRETTKVKNIKTKNKMLLVSVFMGLGHLRAANSMKEDDEDIYICGSPKNCDKKELNIWEKIRKSYYLLSKAIEIPIIGKFLKKSLLKIEEIKPYYPIKDHSKPALQNKFLYRILKKHNLCEDLCNLVQKKNIPVLNTFYASAHAINETEFKSDNFLLITDSDFNRVWVPHDPKKSKIKYLAPCSMVTQRLKTYGIKDSDIYLTGFPLPKENIGSAERMEILKKDLYQRLLRLDPKGKFFSFHQESVKYWLDINNLEEIKDKKFTLMFAIGGAGAQVEMAKPMIESLKESIKNNKIQIIFSAGIKKDIYKKIKFYIKSSNMEEYINKGISIVYSDIPDIYFKEFNNALRNTDILWTKPSELSFYCALGIPLLLSPSIGPHETLNKWWLREIHAGVSMPGPVNHVNEWIFDFREKGRFAEAAWDGFLKGRKLGAYKIRNLMLKGQFNEGTNPLDR